MKITLYPYISFSISFFYAKGELTIPQREYGAVFKSLKGENINLCLPNEKVPDAGLVDYTDCQ